MQAAVRVAEVVFVLLVRCVQDVPRACLHVDEAVFCAQIGGKHTIIADARRYLQKSNKYITKFVFI